MVSTTFLILIIAVAVLVVLLLRALFWQIIGSARARRSLPRSSAVGPEAAIVRLGAAEVDGVPLMPVVLAGLGVLVLLGGLVEIVVSHHGTVRLDQAADDFFRPYRAAWLLKAGEWITAIGAGPSLAAILATATALLWSGTRARLIAPLWISFLGAQATTWTAKYIIARPRPAFLPGITEWNPSFPSGHATATTALVGMLGIIVAASRPGARARFEAGFWAVVIVALICFSRIFLGVHFVTDVVAGVLVGMFWLLVGYTILAHGPRRRRGG